MKKKDDLLNLEQNNKKNLKKPLVYGAVAFLFFIIGVLIFAIYSNTSLNEDKSVVIPPEEKEESFVSFKEIPIEEDFKNNTLAIKKLIDNENQSIEEKNTTMKKEDNLAQKEVINSAEKIEENLAKVDNANKNEVKIEEKPKQEAEQQEVKATKKIIKDYYIQVGALMKHTKPDEEFLELIKKKGYNYELHEVTSIKDGKKLEVIKILIGPFSKEEVRKEFIEIKKEISENAFIYRMK